MSTAWVVTGTIAQVVLGAVMGILAMFGSAGAADHASRAGRALSPFHGNLLDWSIYVVPALFFLSAIAVVFLHRAAAGSWAYWLYAPPVVVAGLYVWFITRMLG